MKKKIAFIVQRYGLEVNGGAEYHCRLMAERLKDIYDVEVLTTCAKDPTTWANEYEASITSINGIKVHRFISARLRDRKKFRLVIQKLRKQQPYQKLLRLLGLLDLYEKIIPSDINEKDYSDWVMYQGPYVPDLVNYLKKNHKVYDVLIFFTYLYYPTIEGIKIAPEKSILIPTAHDELSIYFPFFKKLFNTPKAILYNTLSEKRFVNKLAGNYDVYSAIAGIGIDASQPSVNIATSEILKTDSEYLLYIGRIDIEKGCKMLFEYFTAYKKTSTKNIALILIGQPFMPIPEQQGVISLGFVSEDIKINLLKNAVALVIPSFYESLSLVTLESMAYGVPVIANEKCEVLKDHIDNSHAGFLFGDYESFKVALDTVFNPKTDRSTLSKNAKTYITENYTWDVTIKEYRKAIDYVSPR